MEGRNMRNRTTKGRGRLARASPERKAPANPSTLARKASPGRRASPSRRASPGRKASPARNQKMSPPRRSSRPRSTIMGQSSSSTTVKPPSPIKEAKESKTSPKKMGSNLPMTSTTNTSTRSPIKSTTTSSVHSSYSSKTQETVDIRPSTGRGANEVAKLGEYIRNSVEKALRKNKRRSTNEDSSETPTTEAESRYSRSLSRSVYDDEKNSDSDDAAEGGHFKSLNASPLLGTSKKIEAPKEFGGCLGIVTLMLLVPVVVYYLQWTCGKNSCDFKSLKLSALIDVNYLAQKVFQGEAVGAYVAYSSGIILLSALMFGRNISLPSDQRKQKQVHKFNALPIAVFVTIAFIAAEYLGFAIADFVLRHYLRFCIYGIISAFITAQLSYLRASLKQKEIARESLNPYGQTGNPIVDFALGRQLSPKLFGFVEYKLAFYRLALITTLLIAECFLYKKIQLPNMLTPEGALIDPSYWEAAKYFVKNIKYESASVLTAGMLLVYVLDAIVFEHHLASSFELQGEGFGFLLLLRYAATPFLLSAVSRYFFERRVAITCQFAVYVPVLLLILGLAFKRLSSAVKYKYRTDPSHTHFEDKETINTFQGRHLLLDTTFWGRLRQPNYTGDILSLISLALPLYLRFAYPPVLSIVCLIAVLLHRTVRVNARNLSRYHSAWVRYCVKVPFYVLPKIF